MSHASDKLIMLTCPCNEQPCVHKIYVLNKNTINITFLSENYHFYSREILQYIDRRCFRNDVALLKQIIKILSVSFIIDPTTLKRSWFFDY